MHQLTNQLPFKLIKVTNNFATKGPTSKYNSYCFYRIIIDIRASKYSTAGYKQFQALQRTNNNITLNKTTKRIVKVQFSIKTSLSIGFTIIETLISQVQFHIITLITPFLLSLADIDKLRVYFNNFSNVIVTLKGDVLVIRRFKHLFLLQNTLLQSFIAKSFNYNPCFLTNVKLQQLHYRFSHLLVLRL